MLVERGKSFHFSFQLVLPPPTWWQQQNSSLIDGIVENDSERVEWLSTGVSEDTKFPKLFTLS